jgi:hypothetical protein
MISNPDRFILAGFAARGVTAKAVRPVAAGRKRAVVVEARKVALLGAGGGIGQVGAGPISLISFDLRESSPPFTSHSLYS